MTCPSTPPCSPRAGGSEECNEIEERTAGDGEERDPKDESLGHAQRRLLDAVSLLDEHLVRRVLGNKSALVASDPPAVEFASADRVRLAARVAIAREEARWHLHEHPPSRATRRADRNAAMEVVEDLGLLAITIDGKPRARNARRAAGARGSGGVLGA